MYRSMGYICNADENLERETNKCKNIESHWQKKEWERDRWRNIPDNGVKRRVKAIKFGNMLKRLFTIKLIQCIYFLFSESLPPPPGPPTPPLSILYYYYFFLRFVLFLSMRTMTAYCCCCHRVRPLLISLFDFINNNESKKKIASYFSSAR